MARRPPPELDRELADLPPELRWRTWMGRVEAVIFASVKPVSREILTRVVGEACRLDELIDDIREELRGRPYDLVAVAGGFRYRTRKTVADAIRASGVAGSSRPALSRYEATLLMAVAYLQPITRAELGVVLGAPVSRDTIAAIRAEGFIASGPRAPLPGALHLRHYARVPVDVRVRHPARPARHRGARGCGASRQGWAARCRDAGFRR